MIALDLWQSVYGVDTDYKADLEVLCRQNAAVHMDNPLQLRTLDANGDDEACVRVSKLANPIDLGPLVNVVQDAVEFCADAQVKLFENTAPFEIARGTPEKGTIFKSPASEATAKI